MRSNRDLISVFVPTYKRPDYLKDCLESIVPQVKRLQIDLYVCDNCSMDRTKKVVESYQNEYAGIIYQVQKETVALDSNQLMFMNLIQSEYCLMIADDDAIRDDCLDIIITSLKEKPKTELILLNADHFCANLKRKERSNFQLSKNKHFYDVRSFFKEFFFKMHFSTMVINMSLLKDVDEKPYLGTYHAYCGVVFEYLKNQYKTNHKNEITVIAKSLVLLRNGHKTYSHERLEVEYKIFTSFFHKMPEFYNNVVNIKLAEHTKKLSNFRWLLTLRKDGHISTQNIRKLWLYMGKKERAKMYLAALMPIVIVKFLYKLVNIYRKK